MFFRLQTDGTRTPVDLRGHYAGPERTACWIVGGGPSLAALPCEEIQRSPAPKFAVNLSGTHLIRPNLWTAYDPTARFHRSTYLDASILKLVSSRRAMDLVPESTFKVCDCPNLLFFERQPQRGFHDFPPTRSGPPGEDAVVDWQDSLIQAIELGYWLGFRDLYLVGCDMHVRPEPVHQKLATERGVEYLPGELLKAFYARCAQAGLSRTELERAADSRPYHFDETKSLAATIQTDWHYSRVVQYLRLSRRSMALAGLEIHSATPDSRLNDVFPYRPVATLLEEIHRRVGRPDQEATRGRYSKPPVATLPSTAMRDFKPHNWPSRNKSPDAAAAAEPVRHAPEDHAPDVDRRRRLQVALDEVPEIEVPLQEIG